MLTYKIINLDPGWDYPDLLQYIRSSIFHVTPYRGFIGIKTSGVILPSRDGVVGPFHLTRHCGKHLGNVCVFDTNELSDEDIIFGISGMHFSGTLYYIFFVDSLRDKLVRHDYKNCPYENYCPRVEKGFHGSIPISLVKKVLRITCKSIESLLLKAQRRAEKMDRF